MAAEVDRSATNPSNFEQKVSELKTYEFKSPQAKEHATIGFAALQKAWNIEKQDPTAQGIQPNMRTQENARR